MDDGDHSLSTVRLGTPLVRYDQTSMIYRTGTQALDSIDLSVRTGEFVAIVGPSGCGKSTLLRLAAGLEKPTSGRAEIETDSVGFVFQEPNLMPWASVARNVSVLVDLAKLPRAERNNRVRTAIEAVGLADFAGQLPSKLSGGMRMRTSLARALALRPEVLLLDEPFGALDALTREDIQMLLLDLYDREGFTSLFVTHSVDEAVLLADRVVVMSARPGRIRAVVEVNLPRPRRRELRFDADYVSLVAAVADLMRSSP
ncbi:ABC transporter ATP-binding protein [soil metagenome]